MINFGALPLIRELLADTGDVYGRSSWREERGYTYAKPNPLGAPGIAARTLRGGSPRIAVGDNPASVLPSYSPDGGQTERGIGWRADLSIKWAAILGDIDISGDEFVSPWGRLTQGTDGRYHPVGRAPQMSLQRVNDGWEEVNGEGTRFTFTAADSVAAGMRAGRPQANSTSCTPGGSHQLR